MTGGAGQPEYLRDLWCFPAGLEAAPTRVVGYGADATDGGVGTVGLARNDSAGAFVILLGGSWNGGRTVMMPGGLVKRVEHGARVVHLACSCEQIALAPPFENDRYQDVAYRHEVSAYYASLQPSARRRGLEAARRAGLVAQASVAFGFRAAG